MCRAVNLSPHDSQGGIIAILVGGSCLAHSITAIRTIKLRQPPARKADSGGRAGERRQRILRSQRSNPSRAVRKDDDVRHRNATPSRKATSVRKTASGTTGATFVTHVTGPNWPDAAPADRASDRDFLTASCARERNTEKKKKLMRGRRRTTGERSWASRLLAEVI